MSNESYFSQYESPNIVIVPTMSCNPSSPKRRKIGNNIIVPIVNNAVCEEQKLILTQDNNKPNSASSGDKMADNGENSSKTPSGTATWASNYMRSIGLDKKSSIWNHKIPRKTASQKSIDSVESPTIITPKVTSRLACTSKTGVEKSDQSQILKKNLTDVNNSKVSKKKVKNILDRNIKDKSKKIEKQSEYESIKSVSEKKCSGIKNKDIRKNQNIIKKDNTKKNDSHKQPNKLCTSGMLSLQTKSGKIMKSTSKKDHSFQLSTKKSLAGHGQKSQNKVEKSDIKSQVTKQTQSKSDIDKPSSSYSTSTNKKKYKNSKCFMENKTSKKSVKVTKNYDISDIQKLSVLNKARRNTELKTKDVHSKVEISDKMKTKEKLAKNKPDLTIKKRIKSPIKRKISETKSYKNIKLVINLICNSKPTTVQCIESSSNEGCSGSTTCTVPNADLDFLNDIDIDEIVESLDTCEKKTSQNVQSDPELNKCQNIKVTSNIQTGYNNTSDAIDLIKTLKGEEDDDLMRISIENCKELLFSNKLDTVAQNTTNSPISDDISKSANSKFTKDVSALLVKTKEGEPEILSEDADSILCNAAIHLKNEVITKGAGPNHVEETCIINKSGNAKETQQAISGSKTVESNGDDSLSPSNSMRTATSPSLSIKLDNNKNKSNINVEANQHQNINPYVCNTGSFSVSNKLTTDSDKTLKLHKDITENLNQEKCECVSIHKNNFTNLGNLDKQDAIKLDHKDETKIRSLPINNPEKLLNTANVNIIVDANKNSIYKEIPIALKTEINNKDIDVSTDGTKQKDTAASLDHQKHEDLNKEFQTYAGNQEENNVGNTYEKSIIAIKDLSDNQNDNKDNNSVTQNTNLQQNEPDINSAENNEDQNNLALNKNIVKEENTIPSEKVQTDKSEGNTEEHYANKAFNKNTQKEFTDSDNKTTGSKEKFSSSGDTPRGNIKCKIDIETVLKLEERLFINSGSKYSIISNIHTGKFSKIFKCKHPNGKYYALKMPTTNLKFNFGKEKKLMLNCLVNDIPKDNFFIVYLVKAFNVGEKWCYLMEYYPKNLDQAFSETGMSFPIEQIQDYARQLVMAVMVLKNKNMVHLDIEPKHILINSANNMLKLCGFDRLCYINKMRVLPNVGTVNYRAPEVILGYKSGFEIDVWSTGLVLFEMAANKKLFPGKFNNDILYKQMCTLGCVPYDMIRKSRYGGAHFNGLQFMRKSGFKGQNVTMISKFYKNNKLCASIYDAYYENWGQLRDSKQVNCDIGKLSLFVKLLQKMLIVPPEHRLPIEFVYANPFIYDAYSYQEW